MVRVFTKTRPASLQVVVVGIAAITWTLLVAAADRVRVPSSQGDLVGYFDFKQVPTFKLVAAGDLPADGELRERLVLFDPTPLFLPSTSGAGYEPGVEVSAAKALADYVPAFKFAENAPTKEFIRTVGTGSLESTAQFLAAPRWFEGMARADQLLAGTAANARIARVDVYRSGEVERVGSVDLLRATGLGSAGWRPMELSVWITEAGAVSAPTTVKSSGVDEIDERIRSIVARELLPTLLLRPGVYRLDVGP